MVLTTNLRGFVLVGRDALGCPVKLETLRLAVSASEFRAKLEKPRTFQREAAERLGEYLARALAQRAAIAEPKDLARLLASYARRSWTTHAMSGPRQLCIQHGTIPGNTSDIYGKVSPWTRHPSSVSERGIPLGDEAGCRRVEATQSLALIGLDELCDELYRSWEVRR